MIMCRPGALFSFSSGSSIEDDGVTFAFDIFIHSPANTIQNLVSLRNAVTNYVSLTVYYNPSDGCIKVQVQNPSWNLVLSSSVAIQLGNNNKMNIQSSFAFSSPIDTWNRVVVDINRAILIPGQNGFYIGRIFINRSNPTRTYFGDFLAAPLLLDTSNVAVDICSTRVSGSLTPNSTVDGNYNMMNFMWLPGIHGNLHLNGSGNRLF